MIRTLDFNALPAGTIVTDQYADLGVAVSATGGAGQAMIFDSANPTGGDDDLASDTLGGVLIISTDGDASDPDDHNGGGSVAFTFDSPVWMKSLTVKDFEASSSGSEMLFYDANNTLVERLQIFPGADGDESRISLSVPDVSRFEVRFGGSGAIDNVAWNDTSVDVDDGPTAVDDFATTEVDTPVIIDLRGNDTDPNDTTETLALSGLSSANGTLTDNGDGTVIFKPAAGFEGDAVINYTVTDPSGQSDDGQAFVTVRNGETAPQGPTATDDTATTPEDTSIVIDVRSNDFDAQDATADLQVSDPSSVQGAVVSNGDGTLTFSPNANFNGPATITYTLTDKEGNTDEGLVRVDVTPVNDAPVAGDDMATTPQDTALLGVPILANDTDPDGDLLRLLSVTSADGTVSPNADGTVDFLPNPGFTGTATLTYVISDRPDGDPAALTDTGVLRVLVTKTPDARDGFVDGSEDADLIDLDYVGDPDGDLVDAGDEVLAGAGPDDDVIRAGAGDDTVIAGLGGDNVLAGDGNDSIDAQDGNDTVDGGAGDDVINTGNGDLSPDLGYPRASSDPLGYDADTDPENDRDFVSGGDGNDTISTGDDRDTIRGDAGADVIDAGIDDDIVDGGTDNDRIVGGEGNDNIQGGAGNDTIYAGNDPDLGLDVLVIPDTATDGAPFSPDRNPDNGRDTVDGGAGDDDIFGGAGADTLLGGAGRDTFSDVNAGDVIDGGSDGIDLDTLDLRGSAPQGGSLTVTLTSDDAEDGFVSYFDEEGSDAGVLLFEDIETLIVPCFTPGTRIATPKGERLVEDLHVGDRVITRDNGMQTIRWIGKREMSGKQLQAARHLRPVLIQTGALGNGLPERDMLVSPQHRVLIANDKTTLYFEEREVLVAAKHLTECAGIDVVDVSHTTYIHIMFDRHEVILSDGAWTESFQPGDMTLTGMGDDQRHEILEIFPELACEAGIESYAAARRSLKQYEARLVAL